MRGKREPIEVRFWRQVDKSGECWLWLGGLTGQMGYGHTSEMGKHLRAHRVSWELANGPVPEGKWVLHTCDNPQCVNPAHLYLGDRSRNMKDAHERGRVDMKKVASAPRPGARK